MPTNDASAGSMAHCGRDKKKAAASPPRPVPDCYGESLSALVIAACSGLVVIAVMSIARLGR